MSKIKKNILFTYITPFHPERGGTGRVTHVLTLELQKRGDQEWRLLIVGDDSKSNIRANYLKNKAKGLERVFFEVFQNPLLCPSHLIVLLQFRIL